MSGHTAGKKWSHLRAAPFSEIADLLEQQDSALQRAGDQLKEGTARIIEAASRCRQADSAIAVLTAQRDDLVAALETLLDDWERAFKGFTQHVEIRYAARDRARAAIAAARGGGK